jgi:hypothetical protein
MNILVLASQAVDAEAVRAALPTDDLDGARVLVVAPALNSSPLAFWMSDSDEAIADAGAVGKETVRALDREGVRANAVTGESEPLVALEDALATFQADHILVFVHGDEDEQRYREDDLIGQAKRRFGVPVTEVVL